MKDLERATGVGREAIRYYIREGLLPEPERPARNVAWYDESYVERIALVKKLQSERFLPLAVIKRIVQGDELPTDAEVRTLLDLHGRLTPGVREEAARAPERLSDLAARVGVSGSEILAIAKTEAIGIATRDGDQWVAGNDVAIVEAWGRARQAGFTEELGYSPEVLRLYVEFCRWLVREELREFVSRVAGKVAPERVQRMAEAGISNAGELLRLLHQRVLLDAIAQGNLPPAELESSKPGAVNE